MIELTDTEGAATGREAEDAEEPRSEALRFTLEAVPDSAVTVKVIGIGGCGGNVVDFMMDNGVSGVDFSCVNTDEQALNGCRAPFKLCMGKRVTQGYGTGSDPEVGREAALENTEELTELLGDADMVYLALGLGGGTGTGAAPVIASLAKQMGALTIALAVKPFAFEGKRRMRTAEKGLDTLLEQVDTAIVVPNERLLEQVEAGSGFFDSFLAANRVATETLVGITDLITKAGIMNCDFADVRALLEDAGAAFVQSSERGGRDAAMQAARDAIGSQAMEHGGLARATKVLVNLTGSGQFGMHDASEAIQLIQREIAEDADLTVGVVRDDSKGENVRVTMIASGFAEDAFAAPQASSEPRAGRPASPWDSERVVDLIGTEHGAPEAAAADGAPSAEAAPPAPPHLGAPAAPVAAGNGAPDAAQAANGAPLEFMPPPNIRAREEAEEEPGAEKPAFFRRRSFFR